MSNTFYVIPKNSDLQHYGVLGMKWGVRRYQNKDGSLTPAGEKRYLTRGATLSRAIGGAAGSLLGGPIAGYFLGRKAANMQIQSNAEKLNREREKEALSKMSDTELRDFNYRKSLENQLSEILSKENKQTGFDFVKSMLGIAANTASVISNVTDIAGNMSSIATKKEKQNKINSIESEGKSSIASIKNDYESRLKNPNLSKDDKIKLNKEMNNKIDSIKKLVENQKNSINSRFESLNRGIQSMKRQTMQVTNKTNIARNVLPVLSKAFNSGVDIDTSALSNKELQKLVDRTRMEQQYLNIVTPTNTRNGLQYVSDVMGQAANVAGIGAQLIRR